MSETKTYLTTELAGYYVAGRKLPLQGDTDGNARSRVGHPLQLTDAEAKYPLLNGEIELAPVAGDGATDNAETATDTADEAKARRRGRADAASTAA